jgi:hypothetical protein
MTADDPALAKAWHPPARPDDAGSDVGSISAHGSRAWSTRQRTTCAPVECALPARSGCPVGARGGSPSLLLSRGPDRSSAALAFATVAGDRRRPMQSNNTTSMVPPRHIGMRRWSGPIASSARDLSDCRCSLLGSAWPLAASRAEDAAGREEEHQTRPSAEGDKRPAHQPSWV